jgi:hypothetical protein
MSSGPNRSDDPGSGDTQSAIASALAVARLRALRVALLGLHKALIDSERVRYERVNGRIENAHAALRLVLESPWFRWLHPIAELIVQMDERLSDETPMHGIDVEAFVDRLRGLLQRDDGDEEFRREYHRTLQEAPDVVMEHARVTKILTDV